MAGAGEGTAGDARRAIDERIAEIRSAGFTASRRGFDRDEVQSYLAALADWLEGLGLGDADRGEVRRELAWVGERTSEILTKAEETGRELREKAAAEAERVRAEAAEEAERVRAEANEETRLTRLEASTYADEARSEAERRAETLLEQATRRRQDLQALIGDLLERRDEIVADGNRLVDELAELFASADEDSAAADDEPIAVEEPEYDEEPFEEPATRAETEPLDAADQVDEPDTEEQEAAEGGRPLQEAAEGDRP